MILTAKQEEGLRAVLQRYHNRKKYAVISGFAGTGKSTLVRFIIEALDIDESRVAYATFTGKAAEVLKSKGNKNAMTLHKLLYDSFPRKDGGFIRKPKEYLEYQIVVVDEISMAPKSMLELLFSHRVFCICLGDPFQLPVIDKDEAHDLLDHPHVFLDQIMRQAAESEIIQLTMKIRNFEAISCQQGNEVIVIPRKSLVTGHLMWADQILCGTNSTRIKVNQQMRQLFGYSGLPQDGEKVVCLRNQWDDYSTDGEAVLVNGMTGYLHNPKPVEYHVPFNKVKNLKQRDIHVIRCQIESDSHNVFEEVDMDRELIMTGESLLDWRDKYALNRFKNASQGEDITPREFAFGYCITCHKSQGSEWDKVTVLEETFPYSKLEHARWLYTACTRPSQKLVLVRPE